MAATLGEDLIFDLDRAGTCTFKHAHGALQIDGVAKAGVAVGQNRQLSDNGDDFGSFTGGGEPHVGAANARHGNGGAADEGG